MGRQPIESIATGFVGAKNNPKKLSWTGKNPLMVRQAHHERVFKLSPEG
jgi:hypothetical protein